MFITPAFAQAAGAPGAESALIQLIPFALVFLIIYFFLIRPQSQRQKQHAAMIAAVRKGDVVVTTGGIVAKITKAVEGQDEIEAQIADGVKVKLLRGAISDVRSKTEAPAKAEKADDSEGEGNKG